MLCVDQDKNVNLGEFPKYADCDTNGSSFMCHFGILLWLFLSSLLFSLMVIFYSAVPHSNTYDKYGKAQKVGHRKAIHIYDASMKDHKLAVLLKDIWDCTANDGW